MTAADQPASLRSRLRELYFGVTPQALKFQAAMVILDLMVIGFFVFSQFVPDGPLLYAIDYAVAAFLAADLGAKLYALGSVRRWMKYPTTWVDLVVLLTLLFPALLHNWGFLRILRLWTLVHRERLWNVLGGGRWDDTYVEDLTKAIVNLIVFIFMAAGLAQVLFLGQHPKLNNFLDAIYFVVTALTTTGFGDITIDTAAGRVFSIVLMLTGITLFFGIAQKAFSQNEKIVLCTSCGQDRHAPDARFCKSCGAALPNGVRKPPKIRRHRHHDN